MGKDMTDLEKFKQLFDEVGQTYIHDTEAKLPDSRKKPEAVQSLDLGFSDGYAGFTAEFLFDADGKYVTYAAWE